MAVQSRDPNDGPHRGPALFSARGLARQQSGFERFIAVVLLMLSLVGSVLAGGGGASAWLATTPVLWGAIAAFILQAVLSYVQWIYAVWGFQVWQYTGAVVVSSILTVAGFWSLVWPWLVERLVALLLPLFTAQIVAAALLVVVALAVDIFPEKTLVR